MRWMKWLGPFQWEFVLWTAILVGSVGGLISMKAFNSLNARDFTELTVPEIIAHRGASAVAPENTRSSIVDAIRVKASVIEFDVRATRDGELVLFHDDNFERLVGTKGSVESTTWADFEAMDVGKWFGDTRFAGENPIRMAFAIELCLGGDSIPLIEHKTGSAAAYAKVIRKLGVTEKVIVQSFNWDFLRDLKEELPDTAIGALGSKTLTSERLAELESLSPNWVGWNYKDLRTSDLTALQDFGAKVVLWTVNDPSVARQWVAAGADGIITDRPAEMAKAFEPTEGE